MTEAKRGRRRVGRERGRGRMVDPENDPNQRHRDPKDIEIEEQRQRIEDLERRLALAENGDPTGGEEESDSVAEEEERDDNPIWNRGRNQEFRPRGQSTPTFGMKIKIPEFEGNSHPDEFVDWLQTVERVFDLKDIEDGQRVKLVAIRLREQASVWWEHVRRKRAREGKPKVKTWEKMKKLLKRKYLPSHYRQEVLNEYHLFRQRELNIAANGRRIRELECQFAEARRGSTRGGKRGQKVTEHDADREARRNQQLRREVIRENNIRDKKKEAIGFVSRDYSQNHVNQKARCHDDGNLFFWDWERSYGCEELFGIEEKEFNKSYELNELFVSEEKSVVWDEYSVLEEEDVKSVVWDEYSDEERGDDFTEGEKLVVAWDEEPVDATEDTKVVNKVDDALVYDVADYTEEDIVLVDLCSLREDRKRTHKIRLHDRPKEQNKSSSHRKKSIINAQSLADSLVAAAQIRLAAPMDEKVAENDDLDSTSEFVLFHDMLDDNINEHKKWAEIKSSKYGILFAIHKRGRMWQNSWGYYVIKAENLCKVNSLLDIGKGHNKTVQCIGGDESGQQLRLCENYHKISDLVSMAVVFGLGELIKTFSLLTVVYGTIEEFMDKMEDKVWKPGITDSDLSPYSEEQEEEELSASSDENIQDSRTNLFLAEEYDACGVG